MNRRAPLPALAALVAVLVSPHSARAGLIFDSGVYSTIGTGAVTADAANVGTITAGDFTIGTPAVIDEVRWEGIYFPGNVAPASDAFTIRFYDLSGPVPPATPLLTYAVGNAVNRLDTGLISVVVGPYHIDSYDASLPATPLAAGRYAFSVQDDTRGVGNYFFWTTGPSPGHEVFYGSAVLVTANATAFQLLGTVAVPEPSGLLMLGTGSLILLAHARARGRSAR